MGTIFSDLASLISKLTMVGLYLFFSGTGSSTFEVAADEEVKIAAHTASIIGAKFSITNADTKAPFVEGAEVQHKGTADPKEQPTKVELTTTNISGPVKLKIKGDSMGSRWTSQNFCLVFNVYPKGG